MTMAVARREPTEVIEQVIAKGDLKELTPAQRTDYFKAVCESVGLNPLTRPFEYITLNGKLTLYARKDATDQLRKLHGVSVQIVSRERIDDVYAVTAKATDIQGRTDESIGAVAIGSLKGDALCNAIMKAETKAKRRVTLSICGLGMLDEAELETIPAARMGEPITDKSVEAEEDSGVVLLRKLEAEVARREQAAEAVKQVKLEGQQPTSEPLPEMDGAAGHVLKLAKQLGWSEPRLINKIYEVFNEGVAPGKVKDFLELASKEDLRKLYAAMNAQAKGGK